MKRFVVGIALVVASVGAAAERPGTTSEPSQVVVVNSVSSPVPVAVTNATPYQAVNVRKEVVVPIRFPRHTAYAPLYENTTDGAVIFTGLSILKREPLQCDPYLQVTPVHGGFAVMQDVDITQPPSTNFDPVVYEAGVALTRTAYGETCMFSGVVPGAIVVPPGQHLVAFITVNKLAGEDPILVHASATGHTLQ